MLGNFACFFIICGFFSFLIYFLENVFQEYHQSVKQFGSRSGPTGPNCLQRLSADNKSRERIKQSTTAAVKILKLFPFFLFFFLLKKICLDISYESARQITPSHEMSRLIFSEKSVIKTECCLLQTLLSTLRVNMYK